MISSRRHPDPSPAAETVDDRQRDPSTPSRPSSARGHLQLLVVIAVWVGAASMLVYGIWAIVSPRSFMQSIDFAPYNRHLVHDAGAFQVGIGVALVAALFVRDGLTVALLGFATASGLHAVSPLADRDLGGHGSDVPILATITVLAIVALVVR